MTMTIQEKIKKILIKEGFIRTKGHFLLKSGKHSADFVNLKELVEKSIVMFEIADLLSEIILDYDGETIDLVIGPAYGANALSMAIGYFMGIENKQMIKTPEGKQAFRNDSKNVEGANVLIVEDVITTGGTVQELIELVRECGGNPVMVASIVDRSKGKAEFGVPYIYGTQFDFPIYEADDCPICQEGVRPLVKLGS